MKTDQDGPTSHEIEVLLMLNGDLPWQSGAWVNACLEFLGGMGYATRCCPYEITLKGKTYLASREQNTKVPR